MVPVKVRPRTQEDQMPAVTVENPLVLPRLSRITAASGVPRPANRIVRAHQQKEGAGIEIWRPFPGKVPLAAADPFLLLDQAGPMVNTPQSNLRTASQLAETRASSR
jgi:hypothetical protein